MPFQCVHLLPHTLTPAAEAASAKLTRTLPHTLSEEVQALEQAVQLDDSPWVVSTDAAILSVLLRAVRVSRVVEFAYTSNKGVGTRRRVNVYRVMHVDGRWYAAGWCQLRQELRSFRLDRIRELAVLDETFTPPQDFDALAYVHSHVCDVPSYDISVWLACPPEQLHGYVSVWNTEIRPEAGGTRLCCQRERLDFFASFLLSTPCDFRIDSPLELLDEFRRLGERCAALLGQD